MLAVRLARVCIAWLAFCDPSHRRHDNCVNALSEADMLFVRRAVLIVTCVLSAPWGGCGHFGKLGDAMEEFKDNNGATSELLRSWYGFLAFDEFRGRGGLQVWNRGPPAGHVHLTH